MIKMYLKDKLQADISGDGKINVMDFALMKKWIMSGVYQKTTTDHKSVVVFIFYKIYPINLFQQ